MAFPTNPTSGDFHLFNADVGSGLTWLDADGSTPLTSAVAGDYAEHNGAAWVKQGSLQEGLDGASWTVGNAFPTNPREHDLHLFNIGVDSGLDWRDTDGSTPLTTAVIGDYAQHDGTVWVKQGNLVGPEGTVTTDPVETVFENTQGLSATLSDRTWADANTIRMTLDRLLTDQEDELKFMRVSGEYTTATITRRFDDLLSAAEFIDMSAKESTGRTVTNTIARVHRRNDDVHLGGFSEMWLHYARRTVQVGGENRTQIVVGFASSRANNINNWRVKVDLISFIGSPGKQSRYTAEVYRNAPETSPPPTPSGGDHQRGYRSRYAAR